MDKAAIINGTAGDDDLVGTSGNDTINGRAGNDILEGGLGADVLSGVEGWDEVSFISATSGVVVNLELGRGLGGEADGDTYSSIENLQGSGYGDQLTGDAGRNLLYGWGGNDSLSGVAGDDVLYGGLGADVLDGGERWDIANYFYAATGVVVDLVNGGSYGEAAGDTYVGIEAIQAASCPAYDLRQASLPRSFQPEMGEQ